MAVLIGVEPILLGPKPCVLPLHHSTIADRVTVVGSGTVVSDLLCPLASKERLVYRPREIHDYHNYAHDSNDVS